MLGSHLATWRSTWHKLHVHLALPHLGDSKKRGKLNLPFDIKKILQNTKKNISDELDNQGEGHLGQHPILVKLSPAGERAQTHLVDRG